MRGPLEIDNDELLYIERQCRVVRRQRDRRNALDGVCMIDRL